MTDQPVGTSSSGLPGKENEVLLFDRQTDPFQLKNIAENSQLLIERLIREELKSWLSKTRDPWLERLNN